MKLTELICNLDYESIRSGKDADIKDIQFDSRKVADGSVFVAIKGTASDGHDYIGAAVKSGAVAVVYDDASRGGEIDGSVTAILVKDSSIALARLASDYFGNPSQKVTLVGVTGTNGKTTTATLLYQMFRKLGHKSGLLSTVINYIDDEAVEATHTTPDPLELNGLLAKMVERGCEYVFMEVSSHSVVQNRIAYLDFDGALFTNITRDHIDYHGTFDNYLAAKKAFFDGLKKSAFAITNIDDKNGLVMLQNTAAKRMTYSTRAMADFRGKILEESFDGMLISVNDTEVNVPFIGRFNVYNLLAVYGAAVELGVEHLQALTVLSSLKAVSGRFETLHAPKGYSAIVDYAHTPDALDNVLATINELRESRREKGTLISIVGCGGNRDKGKRPMMAQSAVRASDKVIITSDNPRKEDPQAIIDDMLAGLNDEQMKNVIVIADRRQAIKTACMMADKGDVILVAGKGHENYQIIGDVKHHFDDHEEIKACF